MVFESWTALERVLSGNRVRADFDAIETRIAI